MIDEPKRTRRTALERAVDAIVSLSVAELRELPAELDALDPWILSRIRGDD